MREKRLKMALRRLKIVWCKNIWTTGLRLRGSQLKFRTTGLRLEGSVPPFRPSVPSLCSTAAKFFIWLLKLWRAALLEFSSLAYCRFFDIKFFGNFSINLFISSLSSWWSKIVAFWNSKTSMMLNRWQFLRTPMPPSAAAESSKEVKLEKICGRPTIWSGGGTRIHNFFLPGNTFGVVASTTRRDICRPTGGQEWVEEKYPQRY